MPCSAPRRDNRAVCSCLANYYGSPPNCRPECTLNSDCPQDKSCENQKCVNPCLAEPCARNAHCKVRHHSPICSCPSGFTGNPFQFCEEIRIIEEPIRPTAPPNPCQPSPCGPFAECRVRGDQAVCSCLQSYIGSPPNCRPECVIHADCPLDKACIRENCADPCLGACGFNAQCKVINHGPICFCDAGYEGDPFSSCNKKRVVIETPKNPCHLSPCGSNARCTESSGIGSCTCLLEYFGDPYVACRPECVLNSDCSSDKACVYQKCVNPCLNSGACGVHAECSVYNHVMTCR